jgi:hypothetical protein
MDHHPKIRFSPLCDLHHCSMRRVMLEQSVSVETRSFHQCERRDCNRIFRDGCGYSDFAGGQFDASRSSFRICSICAGTLYLAEVDQVKKVETWECAEVECDYSEEILSPASR